MERLPVDDVLVDIVDSLQHHTRLVLQAPPGAGKTTRVPLALLQEPWLQGRKILMLEPRRIAARAAAARMALQLGEKVGQTVGYQVRFERKVSEQTRIEVITEGLLTRRLQQDPELADVGLLVFDEFHERSLHTDLGLAFALDSQAALREDLRIAIMSATLDGERLGRFLDAPLIRSEGRSYPVTIHHVSADTRRLDEAALVGQILVVCHEESGSILVFLPGVGEIRRLADSLVSRLPDSVDLRPLYGDMPLSEQQQAIEPSPPGRRKVVLATNIAETSLTIDGVDVVIDSGWQRESRFDPESGLSRLATTRISVASADQRAGRAGRLGAGRCYRLWGESVQKGLIPHQLPEIMQADLAPLVLELAHWGCQDPAQLDWLDPPPQGSWSQGRALLQQLDAVDAEGRITSLGQRMARLPTHPRLSHMLVVAQQKGWGALACDIAALIGERDLLYGQPESSLSARLRILQQWRARPAAMASQQRPLLKRIDKASEQFRHLLGEKGHYSGSSHAGACLALAYPERVARLRRAGDGRYQMVSGKGARLPAESNLFDSPFLAIAMVSGSAQEPAIRLAEAISETAIRTLFDAHIQTQDSVIWSNEQQRVVAERREILGAVSLHSKPVTPSPDQTMEALLMGIRDNGVGVLPWSGPARQLRQRVAFLRRVDDEGGWPDWSDSTLIADLEEWLEPYLQGITSLKSLQQLDLTEILTSRLGWERIQRLEREAPARIHVPSGYQRAVDYGGDEPVLAVKLQELFGMLETPRIGGGRVPLLIHLLSPAGRPVQVTRDLAGFWCETYQEVKKELKGRYPKHPWPDDPLTAVASAHTKRRTGKDH